MKTSTLSIILAGLLIVTLPACVYRMDIEQGNRIDESKLEQLKVGMTRGQVKLLLGEPAIEDVHHANQSHYVYYRFDGDSQETEVRNMTLTYDEGVLTKIEGTLTPAN